MADLIQVQLPVIDAQKIVAQLTSLSNVVNPYFINLANDERSGIRTMAEGREGLVRLVNQIALANPDELRRKDDPALLNSKLKYDELLESISQPLMAMLEKVEQTQLANSKDIMLTADAFTQALQISRGRNSALDQAMMEVDAFNKKYA